MALRADEIPGRAVVDVSGVFIGRVKQLNVDGESWAIASLTVKLSRAAADALDLGWSYFRSPTMEVPTGLVMGAADVIVLRAQVDELHGLLPEPERPALTARLDPAKAAS